MKRAEVNEDTALFHRAKKSEHAFAQLYRTYAPAAYTWFRRHTSADRETAADLTAELFARVIIDIHRFRGARPGSGTAWLFAIVRHLAADYARKRRADDRARRRLLLLDVSHMPGPAEDADLRLDAERGSSAILSAFELLSEPQKIAIRLRVIDELPYKEIALRTGSTPQAERLHVMRGLRCLRQLLAATQQGELDGRRSLVP